MMWFPCPSFFKHKPKINDRWLLRFKFPGPSEDGKHWMRFQSENTIFKFLHIPWNLKYCFDFIAVYGLIKELEARVTEIEKEIKEYKKPQTTAVTTTFASTSTVAPTTES